MVIQPTMSPEGIVNAWEVTAKVFNQYDIPLSKKTLTELVEEQHLTLLIQELNSVIGSSALTCIAGG